MPTNAEWLSQRQAAAYLGLSVPSLRKLAASGAMPSYTPGPTRRHRRFRRVDLDAYLESCRCEVPGRPAPPKLRVRGRPDGRPLRWA